MPGQQTAISHYGEAADEANHQDMETVYFHLVKAEPALPIGTPRQAPAGARVWTPEDWFALPAEKLFPAHAGDFQPRDPYGDVLGTAERLSIQAMRAEHGMTAIGAWSEAVDPVDPRVAWIESGPDAAIPVMEMREDRKRSAMRNLPGKDGYGRERGTEQIHRPDNHRRVEGLAILLKELGEGRGIDVVRNGPAKDEQGALPEMFAHEDGGIEIKLGGPQLGRPSTFDLIEETTAVAVAMAWKTADSKSENPDNQLERAQVAGIIAGHELVQSAGIRCPMAPDYARTVSKWTAELAKTRTPDQVDKELNAATALAAATEWSIRLPTTSRERKRWDRIREQRNPGTEPEPITNRETHSAEHPVPPATPRRLGRGEAGPARPRVTTPASNAFPAGPGHSHAPNAAER